MCGHCQHLASGVQLVHAARLALGWRLWCLRRIAAARDWVQLAAVTGVLKLQLPALLADRIDRRIHAVGLAPGSRDDSQQLLGLFFEARLATKIIPHIFGEECVQAPLGPAAQGGTLEQLVGLSRPCQRK